MVQRPSLHSWHTSCLCRFQISHEFMCHWRSPCYARLSPERAIWSPSSELFPRSTGMKHRAQRNGSLLRQRHPRIPSSNSNFVKRWMRRTIAGCCISISGFGQIQRQDEIVTYDCNGHQLSVRIQLFGWKEILFCDGLVVSRRRFLRGGTHVLWVSEAGQPARYEVDTRSGWQAKVVAVRRNGRPVFIPESSRNPQPIVRAALNSPSFQD